MSKKGIAGCNFMLAPMTDAYEEIIMGAVTKLDTSRVWSETSKLGTVFRGAPLDVTDNLKACFALSYREDVHMTADITLSYGFPCDTDDHAVIAEDGIPANAVTVKDIHFITDCKYALYPVGKENFSEDINEAVEEAKVRGIYKGAMHYASVLKGDIHEIFDYIDWLYAKNIEKNGPFVIQLTLSVNSPSPD